MPRNSANEAQQAQSTAAGAAAGYGSNASSLYGQLTPQATSLVNSSGYDPATLAAITNAGMGATNAPFAGAAGQLSRNAARTKNPAGLTSGLDQLAQEQGIAGGQEAGNIQVQNANFANQQRMAGINLLNSLYGQNVNAQQGEQRIQTGDIGAQTAASPGWAQTLNTVLSGVGGQFKVPGAGTVNVGKG